MSEAGRPPKFKTVEELEEKIEEYFNYCDETIIDNKVITNAISVPITKPYTISGLCVYLNICRDTLCEYEKNIIFSDTIKNAKSKIENYVEENSLTGKLNPTVSIFNLKNNFGWKDKHEIDNNVVIQDTNEILNRLNDK